METQITRTGEIGQDFVDCEDSLGSKAPFKTAQSSRLHEASPYRDRDMDTK